MKTLRKRNLKLDPKPKVTHRFRALCLAWWAATDLRLFADMIHNAALAGDELFFDYLAKYLRNEIRALSAKMK
jgi:hypothetical protein